MRDEFEAALPGVRVLEGKPRHRQDLRQAADVAKYVVGGLPRPAGSWCGTLCFEAASLGFWVCRIALVSGDG